MKKSLIWFLVGVYSPAFILYALQASSNSSIFTATLFYGVIVAITLSILIMTKSDDKYQENLGPTNLVGGIILGLAMTVLSWGLSVMVFNKPNALLGVLGVNPAEAPSFQVPAIGIASQPSSVSTFFLNDLLFGLVMAATTEELFRLPFFAEGEERWKDGIKIGSVTIPGAILYVGFPVGFWACLHGIQAYSDPVEIIPAAINGILLTIYLWKTKCILGAIIGHFLYNAGITTITYINGTAQFPPNTPLFPDLFSTQFLFDGLIFAIIAWGFIFFLLPSLKGKN